MPGRDRLVMIGNGMAGMAFIEKLVEQAPGRYDIAVFGDEPHPNYDRIRLSSALSSEAEFNSLEGAEESGVDHVGIEFEIGFVPRVRLRGRGTA